MWPHTLQMTRDECRGILRRLELESYSHVISVFRAQGGLSDKKAKLLEELRNIFHISQERHRAEARRVSNDEELSTIAELISGPNTWQEWSREGRRAFPMLPRVAPQTALSIAADKVAEYTTRENAKLPYPAATADAVLDDDLNNNNNMELEYKVPAYPHHQTNVVTCDPFKMPDIPAAHKKNLKRNMAASENHHGGNNQKRCLSESITQSNVYPNQLQQKLYSNNNNNNMDMPVGKMTKKEEQIIQQRFFLSQQNKAKKQIAAQGKRTNSAVKNLNNQNTMSKKSQKALLKQKKYLEKEEMLKRQQQLLIQLQQPQLQKHQTKSDLQIQNTYANNINENMYNQPQIQIDSALQIQLPEQYKSAPTAAAAAAFSPTATLHVISHVAASPKKDKNTIKLNTTTKSIAGSPNLLITSTATTPTSISSPLKSTGNIVAVLVCGTTTSTTATTTTTTNMNSPLTKIGEKVVLSTPVQKYIVEDRLITPATITVPQPLLSSGSTGTQVSVSSAQIMTLPHITAAANKLRAINTTILPPGTKLQPANMAKKQLTNNPTLGSLGIITDQQQQQIFNVITHADSNFNLPTHAPPSIINLHNNNSNNNSNIDTTVAVNQAFTALPTQGKVLTTKLLPIVLSNTSSSSTGTGNINSNNNINPLPLSSGTIIKSVTPTVMLNTNTAQIGTTNSGNTYISTLSSGAQVFRKPSILRKANVTPVSSATVTNVKPLTVNTGVLNTAPGAIMGSYKVTSTIDPGTSTMVPFRRVVMPSSSLATTISSSNSSSGSSAIVRPAYKLTPSNGKVFIQTASGTSKFQTSPITSNQQRVSLQNVKIIPPSSGLGSAIGTTFPLHHAQTLQQARATTTTLMVNNKSGNMVFLPTTSKSRIITTTASTLATTTAATTTSSITGTTTTSLVRTSINQNVQLIQKPNVVLINTSSSSSSNNNNNISLGNTIVTQTQYKLLTTNATNCIDNNNSSINKVSNNNNNFNNNNNNNNNQVNKIVRGSNQLINDEDLDILNMPIVVEDNDNNSSTIGSSSTDNIAYTNIINSQQQQQQQQISQQEQTTEQHQIITHQQRQNTGNVVLGIDWEMELDQVAAAAATRAPRFARRAYSVCSPAQQSNKTQAFVLPKQLGRTIQAQIDASGILGNNNNSNLSSSSSNCLNKLGGLTLGFPRGNLKNRHIIGNKTNINNIVIENNNDINQLKKVIVIKPKDQVVINSSSCSNSVGKQILNSNELNINDEGGCIPMDLDNEIIEKTVTANIRTATTTPTLTDESDIKKSMTSMIMPITTTETTTSEAIIINERDTSNIEEENEETTTITIKLTEDIEQEDLNEQAVGNNLKEEIKNEKTVEPCTNSHQINNLPVDDNTSTNKSEELSKNDENILQEEEQPNLLQDDQHSYNGVENQLTNLGENIFEGRDYYELDTEKTNILLAAENTNNNNNNNNNETLFIEENFTKESLDSADV